jgi:TPR repeat protein
MSTTTSTLRRLIGLPDEVRVLERAALAGDLDAQQQLGDIFAEGLRDDSGKSLVRRNTRLAERWLVTSAEAGHVSSFLSLGDLLGGRGDLAGARRWYRRALAHRGSVEIAASNLAATELHARHYARALRWYEKARAAGSGDAAVDCGYTRYYGIGTRVREPHALTALTSKLDRSRITPFAFEEAHYLEALAKLDRPSRQDRTAVAALLNFAAQDGDYPEASALLDSVRAGVVPRRLCRCRRGRPKVWAPSSPCTLHRVRR